MRFVYIVLISHLLKVLTAYARECERAGVRVTKWREATGCRNVKPFKYSGEHISTESTEISDDENRTTVNDVMNYIDNIDGIEEYDDVKEPLDMSKLTSSALPAFRYKSEINDYQSTQPLSATSTSVMPEDTTSGNKKRKKEKNKKSKSQRKRERRRRRRKKEKEKRGRDRNKNKFVRKNHKDPITNYRGFTIETISNGGSKKRLKWGANKKGSFKPPPFDMLLTSVEESYPHVGMEDRTNNDEYEYIVNYDDYNVDDFHQSIVYGDLPSSRSRSQPPPLHESGETRPASAVSSHLPHFSNPSRKNYKRRR